MRLQPLPISAGGGDRVEYRERGDDHGQSAEHADRIVLRDSLSRFSGASGRSPSWDFSWTGACCTGSTCETWTIAAADRSKYSPAGPRPVQTHQAGIVVAAVVVGFFLGVDPAMMAALGAAVLLITRTLDPQKVYKEVDWGLLVFFVGLFMIVGGAENAGITTALLELRSTGTCNAPAYLPCRWRSYATS